MKLSFCGKDLKEFDGAAVAEEVVGLNSSNSGIKLRVTSIDLSHNLLSFVRGGNYLPFLTTLNLSHNKLVSLGELSPCLQKLNCSHNELTNLRGIELLSDLVEFNVSNNKLVELPKFIPSSIVTLNLSRNFLVTTSPLSNLHKLLTLNLQHNAISKIDDVICLGALKSLRNLDLFGNPVEAVPSLLSVLCTNFRKLARVDGVPLSQVHQKIKTSAPPKKPRSFIQPEAATSSSVLASREVRVQELERIAKEAFATEEATSRRNKQLLLQLGGVSEVADVQGRSIETFSLRVREAVSRVESLTLRLGRMSNAFLEAHDSVVLHKVHQGTQ